ncbi:hypothetical protein PMG11_06135 [Penicillium brasilianum]|uniref:Uncharacterized protein n=1 Tax=Penicillium brasilianum TaxID=104259 RepID=A0A0F7TL30_PENBI|nr:hypothetical protein PMG11_06135 [Penicillium brasilianum]
MSTDHAIQRSRFWEYSSSSAGLRIPSFSNSHSQLARDALRSQVPRASGLGTRILCNDAQRGSRWVRSGPQCWIHAMIVPSRFQFSVRRKLDFLDRLPESNLPCFTLLLCDAASCAAPLVASPLLFFPRGFSSNDVLLTAATSSAASFSHRQLVLRVHHPVP